jgi:hypothetical protein
MRQTCSSHRTDEVHTKLGSENLKRSCVSFKEMRRKGVHWIHMSQGRAQLRDLLKVVMNIPLPLRGEEFLE